MGRANVFQEIVHQIGGVGSAAPKLVSYNEIRCDLLTRMNGAQRVYARLRNKTAEPNDRFIKFGQR